MSEVSIVIPTYNAGDALRRSLPPLASMAAVGLLHEVILADGGSDDVTSAIAEDSGAVLITAPKGRGGQLAAGGDAARGGDLGPSRRRDPRTVGAEQVGVRPGTRRDPTGARGQRLECRAGTPCRRDLRRGPAAPSEVPMTAPGAAEEAHP